MLVRTDVAPLGELKQNQIFSNADVQFVIPSIQRSYQWCIGHDSKENLNDSAFAFIEDLIRFSDTADRHDEPYFLGTLIVYNSHDGNVDVMDGQQRWTTLTALMAAIHYLLDGSTGDDTSEIRNNLKRKFLLRNDNQTPLLKSKVDLDNEMLSILASLSGDIDLEDDPRFKNQHEGYTSYRRNGVTYKGRNLYIVSRFFVDRLKKEFQIVGPMSSRRRLIQFYDTISKRVMVNLTLSRSSRLAYRMFITANARGTPLTNFDILRGLVLARNQAITGEENNDDFNNTFNVTEHFIDEIVSEATSPNDAIDKLIADALGIYVGERISKASVLGHLEDEISGFTRQDQLLRFAHYFMKYIQSYSAILNFHRLGGMNYHSYICYASPGKKMPQHTVLYTAAVLSGWSEANLTGLLRIIMCFFIRTDICTKTATKKWYSVVPTFGNSILNPSGESPEAIIRRLARSFSEYDGNPDSDELKAAVHQSNFSVASTSSKSRMVALFYALEGIQYHIKKQQQGLGKVACLMPVYSWHLRNHYGYGDETILVGKYSRKLGNIFILSGTKSEIEGISESPASTRCAEFFEKSGIYDSSEFHLAGTDSWGYEDIDERTDWLADCINDDFPQACWKDEWRN